MPYIVHSTKNPLGKRPWTFATSNNGLHGLNLYTASNFVIPGQTVGNPLNQPSYAWGAPAMPSGAAARSTHPQQRRHCARMRARSMQHSRSLGKYIASSFPLPSDITYSGPPPWSNGGMAGLGDYAVDPATMPAPPAGMQYDANYNLVPVAPAEPSPVASIGLLAVSGFAAWWLLFRKNQVTRGMSLPVA
jgi:hypothetical protein